MPRTLLWLKHDWRWRDHGPLAQALKSPQALALGVIEPQWLDSPECAPRHVRAQVEVMRQWGREAAQRGLPSCAVTFEPHPRDYFAKVLGKPAIYQDRSAAGLALGLGEALWDLPDDAKEADKRIVNLVRALGPFVRLPTSQPLRTAKYLFDLAAGDREARNPADFASGVVYGERDGQPANPLNLVGDAISGPR
jgi:hypothetical protein